MDDRANDSDGLVIVGAGIAAGELATGLRQHGFEGSIVMIGDEPHLPYQRPPLSKAYLSGDIATFDSLIFKPRTTYDSRRISLIFGVRVTRIRRSSRRILLADGRELGYAKLVLAVGGRPRMLEAWKGHKQEFPSNLHCIRTIDDVNRLRPQFVPDKRLVIIGGGYIGLEVAAVAVKLGLRVTVVEALPRVLSRVTAPALSLFYERVHREAGVDVRTGLGISGFDLNEEEHLIRAVVLTDGTRIAVDVVIAGIGMIPNVELAEAAHLEVHNGICVDENTRTSDPNIFAIGDCTSHPNGAAGCRVRLESVPNALEQARAAAATICGKQRPYRTVPWFWSDQYDLKLQIAGLSQGYDEVVLRGSIHSRSFAAFYLKQRRIIAVDAVNRFREFAVARELVAQHALVDPANIANESVPLVNLATA